MNIRSVSALIALSALSLPVLAQAFDSASSTTRRTGTIRATASSAVGTGPVRGSLGGVPPVDLWLHVLHANDGESKFLPLPAPATNFGGASRFKTLSDQLKAQAQLYPAGPEAKGHIMISSGDNFLAGSIFNASLTNGVPFYDTIAMEIVGFDAIVPGNHDFDFGPDVFADFVSGFTSGVKFVTANLDFTNEPAPQALVNQGRIARSTVITVQGRKIGVVGATTPAIVGISTPRNIIVNSVLPAVQAEIDALTAQGVKIIILSSHLQSITEEIALVPQLRDVDIVIAGGGSELLATPPVALIPGETAVGTYPASANRAADGRAVPIVTTNGEFRYIGRLVAGFDANGDLITIDPISNPVRVAPLGEPDGVAPNAAMETQVVAPALAAVAAQAANVLATSQVPLDGIRANVRSRETNLGNLIADSTLWWATVQAPIAGTPVPDVAFQNGGGIRNNSVYPAGPFTQKSAFDAVPFANFIAIVPNVSAERFKEILENAVSRVAQGDGRFAQISGFRFVWDASRPARTTDASGTVVLTVGSRVREVVLNDGTVIVRNGSVVPRARSLNIATIDFLANGGDFYPFGGAPFTRLGATYQLALEEFLIQERGGSISALDYPVGGEGRIERLN